MDRFTIFLLLLGLSEFASSLKFPRNPDQIEWARNTCHYEKDLAEKDKKPFCFDHCFWLYLGFYEPLYGSISVDKLKAHFKGLGLSIPSNIDVIGGKNGGNCHILSEKIQKFKQKNLVAFKKAFYDHESDVDRWYWENEGKVKAVGQMASEFCKTQDFKGDCDELNCRYYYYRLIDEDNKFMFYRKLNRPGITEKQFSDCGSKAHNEATGCKVAKKLQACLKEVTKNQWEDIEDYLDRKTRFYFYY